MTKDPQDQIDRLFSEALTRPAEQRAAFLKEHCDESEIRQQVASLLEDYDAATDLFDGLADAAVAPMLSTLQGRGDPEAEFRGADPLDLEGTQVGRYRVEAHLGGGGMGVVYRARDTALDRPVALKFLPPLLAAHPEAEKRFAREAKAAAALDHPHIATIHEIVETEDGHRFIAMAYYEGKTLKEKIGREGALPIEEALGYAEQIAEALVRAHAADIVHRDVKPANVMVTAGGTVKLLDFGLAQVAAETRLTDPEQQLGTAAYMSPEQAEGEEVDAQTDVWALGVVLYEMLTGERPFEGERETAVLHAILHEEPERVGAHRPDLSPALERIVERCLQKDRDRRYGSAAALRNDLQAARRGESGAPTDTPGAEGERTDRSIAVLPLETLGAQEPTAFTDGIHGDLLTRLSNVGGLQVISRTSVRTYRDTDKALHQIARELGVTWVVEGEVQEVGEQVQVNARLVNARTDRQAWAQDYRRVLTAENLFQIQGEITGAIAQSLEMELTSAEKERVERRPTENLDAYRLYAQGREHLDQRTEDGLRRAFECFRRAIEEDSSYALAWTGLTDALSLFEFYGFALPDDAPAPMKAAQRAVDLGPNLGEAHAALGILHAIRHEGIAALRELERAVELAPSYAESYVWLGWLHLYLDRPEAGLPFAERAVDLDPLAPAYRVYLAENYLANGKADAALREARRAREIQPEYGLPHYMEGVVLHHQGRLDDATAALEQCLSCVPPESTPTHAEVRAALAVTRAASGNQARARELGEQIDRAEAPFSKGLVHAALGHPERAFECFEQIRDWGSFTTEHARYFFPTVLGPLREDPRYDELLRTVNEYWGLHPDGTLPDEGDSPGDENIDASPEATAPSALSRSLRNGLFGPHRWSVGLATVLGLAVLALSIPALHWQFTAPRIGIELAPTPPVGAKVTAVNPGGSAAAAGVQPGDTLLSVGRITVPQTNSDRSLVAFQLDLINAYREGQPADWTVIRNGTQTRLSATLVGLSSSVPVSRGIVLGVFWAIALFLLWARPDREHVRHLAFTIFALTASILFLVNRRMAVDTPLGFVLHQASNLGLFLAPALLIHLGVIFPVCTFSRRARRRVLWITYGVYFLAVFVVLEALLVRALFSPDAPYTLPYPSALQDLHYRQINLWLHVVDFLVCGVFIYLNGRRVESPALRDQIKWVLWAVLLTVGIDMLAVGTALYAGGVDMGDLYPYRNYLYLLIAVGLLISVFRHDLFDVDAVIRQSAVYFFTTAVLLVLFAGAQEGAERVLSRFIPAESQTASTWTAVTLAAVLFEPIRSWMRTKAVAVLPMPDG